MADAYYVREIAYCGEMSEILFFVVKPGADYEAQNALLLTQELSGVFDETVLVMERGQMKGELGERLLETERKL